MKCKEKINVEIRKWIFFRINTRVQKDPSPHRTSPCQKVYGITTQGRCVMGHGGQKYTVSGGGLFVH